MNTLASSWNRRPKRLDLPINVFNRQRGFPVDRTALLRYLHELSVRLEIRHPFAVVLVSDRAMRRFNRQFAGKATTTDVLSFPTVEEDWGAEPCLGDIIISVERAETQRPDTLFQELQRLALHGLLHLLGYDHVADGGEMETLERKLQREFGLASP